MDRFVDTHAHLLDAALDGSLEGVLTRATAAGVEHIVCVSTNPAEWNAYAKMCAEHSEILSWEIGIHPTEISKDSDAALEALASYFVKSGNSPQPVAIGEIGLDYYSLPASAEAAAAVVSRQKEIFRRQLFIAAQLGVKVCIHAREPRPLAGGGIPEHETAALPYPRCEAFNDSFEEIENAGVDFKNVVFHCFSGSEPQLKRLVARGGRASFTGIATFKNAESVRLNIAGQGLEKLMLETDSPFLAPVPLRGRTNEPANIPLIAAKVAQILNTDVHTVAERTTANAEDFFGF